MSSPGPHSVQTSRLQTTDLIGPVLLFVGGFLLAAAIALPTLLVDGLRTIPLSTDVTTTALSSGVGDADAAQMFDRCSLGTPTAQVVDAELVRQQRFVAVQPSDADRVTLQAGTSIQADQLRVDGREVDPQAPRAGSETEPPAGQAACTDPTVAAVRDRITLDRTTALPDLGPSGGQPGSSEIQYDSNAAPIRVPDRSGYTYLLPFGVTDTEHIWFDVTTRRAVPLRPAGATTLHGRDATRFVADIPDTDLHQITGDAQSSPPTIITRPAAWFGVPDIDPARELTATLHHSGRTEIAVDTATGTILDQQITIEQNYRFIDTSLPDRRLTALSATFGYDNPTQARMSDRATSLGTPVTIWGRVVPILAAVAGLAFLAAGLTLITRGWPPRRPRPPAAHADPTPSS
ncbi:DUF3068 domain-containing protein [Gordonia sp. HNM0687]|uniref:DUF3068 domain-containing protein n=1 Tax=Gordonia mangrovi TaxID=2665643 RepID=A0A6L7GTD6_9ACTN|nr:DUF3068 domain-containing protein [Gordonia mangrovi]MXP21935.1 DUF3068 domain-containing protein [Gordonia mangrovi]UVF76297.1 DUF3068 domain-containing protein [Gordonia mangrovi]